VVVGLKVRGKFLGEMRELVEAVELKGCIMDGENGLQCLFSRGIIEWIGCFGKPSTAWCHTPCRGRGKNLSSKENLDALRALEAIIHRRKERDCEKK